LVAAFGPAELSALGVVGLSIIAGVWT